jgi:hypothetical protein
MHVDALAELVLKRMEDIDRIIFFFFLTIGYIRSIFAWLSCSPLFFATNNTFFFFFFFFFFFLTFYDTI